MGVDSSQRSLSCECRQPCFNRDRSESLQTIRPLALHLCACIAADAQSHAHADAQMLHLADVQTDTVYHVAHSQPLRVSVVATILWQKRLQRYVNDLMIDATPTHNNMLCAMRSFYVQAVIINRS